MPRAEDMNCLLLHQNFMAATAVAAGAFGLCERRAAAKNTFYLWSFLLVSQRIMLHHWYVALFTIFFANKPHSGLPYKTFLWFLLR
jgi:hypothetical protein